MRDDTIRHSGQPPIQDQASAIRQVGAEAGPEAAGVVKIGDRVGVGAGDENVAKLQLAARWSEQYAPDEGDTLDAALQRFRRVYNYLDSVTKLVDPNDD